MNRRAILLSSALAIVLLLLGAGLLMPRSAITKENFELLHEGMTLHEVEAVLRGPARNEATERMTDLQEREKVLNAMENGGHLWVSNDSIIAVYLDRDGRVWMLHYSPVERADSTLSRLRSWFWR